MSFGIARAPLLTLLADAMEIPAEGRSAFLGRFQHLQRLALVEGINPGRGKAAEYQAHQVLVIAIAFQMLQLGLTPERAVMVIKQNQDLVRLGISLAIATPDTIEPALLWFDPALLTRTMKGRDGVHDLAEATFNYGGAGTGEEMFRHFFVDGYVQRTAFISISGVLWHLAMAFDDYRDFPMSGVKRPQLGKNSLQFLVSLREWFDASTPDSLA